jgi:conjugation transfer TcpE-like protein
MQFPTYTHIWRLERRLYRIFDLELPRPVSEVQLVAFLVAGVIVLVIGRLLGVPLTPQTLMPQLGLAGFASWLASQPIADGKRPHEWVVSQLRYLREPRCLYDFADPREPDRRRLRVAMNDGGDE